MGSYTRSGHGLIFFSSFCFLLSFFFWGGGFALFFLLWEGGNEDENENENNEIGNVKWEVLYSMSRSMLRRFPFGVSGGGWQVWKMWIWKIWKVRKVEIWKVWKGRCGPFSTRGRACRTPSFRCSVVLPYVLIYTNGRV